MNLYKILFSNTAPKDSKEGIVTYLLANSEEEVYHFIDKNHNYECWKDREEEGETFEIYDDDYNKIGTETFKEKILRLKGEMNDEDNNFSDAYYGITLYGWELVTEDTTIDFTELIALDVVKNCL